MPDRPWTDADVETVARVLAVRYSYASHASRCPVWIMWIGRPTGYWVSDATMPDPNSLSRCDCQIMVCAQEDARATLAALAAAGWIRIDPDEPHVIEFRRDGWTIQHPLRCRPDLFGCEANRVGESLPGPAGPPPDGLGRYECQLIDGRLSIGARRG